MPSRPPAAACAWRLPGATAPPRGLPVRSLRRLLRQVSELGVDLPDLRRLLGLGERGVAADLDAVLPELELTDGNELGVGRLAESRDLLHALEDVLLALVLAIAGDEGLDLRLLVGRQVLAPDQRIPRDERRGPEDLHFLALGRVLALELVELLAVVAREVDLLVEHRQQVDP